MLHARTSGADVDAPLALVVRFQAGKVASMRTYTNPADALEAVGLRESAMSRENVDTLKRVIALYNNWGDREAVLAAFHPDVEWRDLMHGPDAPERVHGVPAIREIWDQWEEAFDEFTVEVEEYIDVGDSVVTATHWRGQGKGSGMAIDLRAAEVYEFKDGQIVRATLGYPDKGAALEAAGLSG